MNYTNFTPIWTPTSPAGVTDGTISVPTIQPDQWSLKEAEADRAVYYFAEDDIIMPSMPRVELQCRTVSNPYGADKQNYIPLALQVPGLTSRKVYLNFTQVGTVQPACETCDMRLVPIRSSIMFEIPIGASIHVDDLVIQTQAMLAWLGRAITDGTVEPLDRVPSMANGSLRI
jgi:hypothetical protein